MFTNLGIFGGTIFASHLFH